MPPVNRQGQTRACLQIHSFARGTARIVFDIEQDQHDFPEAIQQGKQDASLEDTQDGSKDKGEINGIVVNTRSRDSLVGRVTPINNVSGQYGPGNDAHPTFKAQYRILVKISARKMGVAFFFHERLLTAVGFNEPAIRRFYHGPPETAFDIIA